MAHCRTHPTRFCLLGHSVAIIDMQIMTVNLTTTTLKTKNFPNCLCTNSESLCAPQGRAGRVLLGNAEQKNKTKQTSDEPGTRSSLESWGPKFNLRKSWNKHFLSCRVDIQRIPGHWAEACGNFPSGLIMSVNIPDNMEMYKSGEVKKNTGDTKQTQLKIYEDVKKKKKEMKENDCLPFCTAFILLTPNQICLQHTA